MYELVKITENCYYIESPAKIGIIKINDTDVALIDSGNDKDAGKRVLKLLQANGWSLKAIYNTHSNSDHIGGNKYLQEQTGCEIFAPSIECDMTSHPILEPAFLYGGFPFSELRHKFLLAKESNAQYLTPERLPSGVEIIHLPGHFFDMVGFRTSEDIVFLADCLSSRETLDKYAICFIYDVAGYLQTLDAVKSMKATLFVPSHASPTEDISELAQYNIDKMHEIADKIVSICSSALTFEVILQRLFEEYSLKMTFEQYVLVGSTVRSYLSWLKENGRLSATFDNNLLLWKAI